MSTRAIPIRCIARETVRLLRARMGLDESKLMLTFQSRFGRAEWLQPYTDKTVEALAQRGVKSLAVVTPGFSADCLETLEEIAVENAEIFKAQRRREFCRDPVPQRQRGGMAVISHLVSARAARLDLRGAKTRSDLLGRCNAEQFAWPARILALLWPCLPWRRTAMATGP